MTDSADTPRGADGAPTPRRAHNYLAGVLTGQAFVSLAVGVNLWLTPFTLRFLDRDEYALFVFSNDLLTWLVLLDLGMMSGLRARPQALTRSAEALLNLCLSVLLARHYGLVGIAVATTAAAVCTSCWNLPRLAADYFGCGFLTLLRATAAPLVLPVLALVPVAVCLRLFVAARGGYLNALAAAVTVGACGLILLWCFAFGEELRARVRQTLRGLAHFGRREP